jgi:hypothetical protein
MRRKTKILRKKLSKWTDKNYEENWHNGTTKVFNLRKSVKYLKPWPHLMNLKR